ncbi:MAG TPA: ABC transporter permease [Longimicrobiales bacterium]
MRTLLQDVRYAARSLRRNPGFAVVALLTLALGIGANSAIFSVISGVLLRPLPYEEGERLVRLEQYASMPGMDHTGISVQELRDYREGTRALSGLVEYHSLWFTLLDRGVPERVQAGVVSWDFFEVLGVEPILGRTFLPSENREGAEPVLVLGHEFWRTRFGGDPGVIGRTVEMNDQVHTIVGVLPPLPDYPGNNDVWVPWYACPFRTGDVWTGYRDWRALQVFGRLRPGTTIERARADVARVAGAMFAEHPEAYPDGEGFGATVVPLREELTRTARPVFLVLFGMAGFVLLIACANVANLTLARMSGREQELAVRSALGASRGRLTRQLLTESALLAVAGGALGLLVAVYATDLLAAFAARFTPRAGEVAVDGRVLLFTLGVSVATGVAIGLVSAVLFGRSVESSLREGGGHATAGAGRQRIRSALVAAQLAGTFMLLIGAGLMIQSFLKLQRVDPGFDPEHVLTMRIDLDWSSYLADDDRREFYRRLLEKVGALPGVVSAGLAGYVPLGGGVPSIPFQIAGRPVPEGGIRPRTDHQVVSPGYFETLHIPLLRGRTFTARDHEDATDVVVISRSLARRYWGDENPIGARMSGDGEHWATVVGVVGDVKQEELAGEVVDQVYIALSESPPTGAHLMIRTTANPTSVARQAIAAVHSIDPRQPVAFVRTLEEVRGESIAAPRLTTVLLGLFGALALAISVAGIAGLIAFTVGQRTQELGIRIALGAEPGRVLWMVARRAVAMVAVGLGAGAAGALALSRFIAGWLYDVSPTDPGTFIGVSLALLAAAMLAAYAPARRATRIDPVTALRSE